MVESRWFGGSGSGTVEIEGKVVKSRPGRSGLTLPRLNNMQMSMEMINKDVAVRLDCRFIDLQI